MALCCKSNHQYLKFCSYSNISFPDVPCSRNSCFHSLHREIQFIHDDQTASFPCFLQKAVQNTVWIPVSSFLSALSASGQMHKSQSFYHCGKPPPPAASPIYKVPLYHFPLYTEKSHHQENQEKYQNEGISFPFIKWEKSSSGKSGKVSEWRDILSLHKMRKAHMKYGPRREKRAVKNPAWIEVLQRRRPDLNRWIRVLQTHALPLGYCALSYSIICYITSDMTPTGIEPVLPPWKGDVLTAWPWSPVSHPSRLYRKVTIRPPM